MRTNIDIDDRLLAEAMASGERTTKKQLVEDGLRALIRVRRQQQALKNLEGSGWDGDEGEIEGRWSWPSDPR
jgi:Arc/MetJ family transcription regulator